MAKKVSNDSSSVVEGILGFLSDTGKTNLLPSVAHVLDEAVGKTRHADKIVITSAVAMTRLELNSLGSAISHFLENTLPVENVVDKKLIGGFSIRVGDFFLDASLEHEIENIHQMLIS